MMDVTLVIGGIAVAVGICIIVLLFLKKGKQENVEEDEVARPRPVLTGPAPRENLPAGARNRRPGAVDRLRRAREAEAARRNEEEGSSGGEDGEEFNFDHVEGRVGAKKRAKLEEKARKRADHEAMLRERAEKNERDAMMEEDRLRDEARQRKIEAQKEEEARIAREEKEKREYEEYLVMKAQFAIEEEGQDAMMEADESQLMQQFIDHIKNMKVVLLEDLAGQFNIKTQDVIDRIDTLMADGTLTGVLDDRGKFIYITMSELESVAKFIKQRGRVSIQELAESSNRLIRLVPDTSVSVS